ncbi:MAG: GIY-YIG nuclease family protein [Planctomycetota bacterium]|nr:GIY-YIG nuclease family protein [Planctomycetota bacterium]
MKARFWYVYMLQSEGCPDRWYVGMTEDLHKRIEVHNAGGVPHTSKFRPWRIETAVAFRDKAKAVALEKYLKSQSGRAFAKKRF